MLGALVGKQAFWYNDRDEKCTNHKVDILVARKLISELKTLRWQNFIMLFIAGCINAFERGTTKIAARGGYSNTDKTMIYFVANRFQIAKMRNIVQSIDPKAFVTISDVADVFKANDK